VSLPGFFIVPSLLGFEEQEPVHNEEAATGRKSAFSREHPAD
jgi:hypothetical protein